MRFKPSLKLLSTYGRVEMCGSEFRTTEKLHDHDWLFFRSVMTSHVLFIY